MRKRIALILAVAMLFSVIMPMSVSAASDNSISYVPTVADDHVFYGGPGAGADNNAPVLRIEEDRVGEFTYTGPNAETFRLNLSNAEFTFVDENDITEGLSADIRNFGDGVTAGTTLDLGDYEGTITRRTDSSVTVRLTDLTAAGIAETGEREIQIPMYTELTGEGEARVTIDPLSSRVSGGTLTFAIGQSGETTAFVDETEDVARGRHQVGGTIIIDEVTAGSLTGEGHGFRLRLPNNFEWENTTVVRFEGFSPTVATEGLNYAYDNTAQTASGQVNYFGGTAPRDGSAWISVDGRNLEVRNLDFGAGSSSRGSIIIEPRINVTRDANFGDVNVNLTGYGDISSASSLEIAEYVDYGAAFEAEEDGELEFFVGRLFDNSDEEYEVEFTVEETVDNSFIEGREIDFVLPDWVWITDIEAKDDAKSEGIDLDRLGSNEFSYEVGEDEDELTFNLRFTINGNAPIDATEDIMIKISGAGIEEMEEQLAVAKKPVTVEVAEQTETLSIGTMKQDAPEIIVKETEAGALIEGGMLRLQLRDSFGNSIKFDDFDVEVVEGDIELTDDDTYESGVGMEVEIDVESTEASTIRFYNIKMDVDRSAPMGDYQIDVRGTAVVENLDVGADGSRRSSYGLDYKQSDQRTQTDGVTDSSFTHLNKILGKNGADFSSRVFRADYVTIGTPIDLQEDVTRERVTMTVGQTTYMVGDEQMTMDAAPFVQDGRLMVPVAHVSRALGISRNAVVWDGDARTVTIYADKVMQMEIGSRTMLVNGVPSDMGAAASIVSDRTFVPVSRFARALGIDYTWDAAAQTVTFHEEE